MDNHETVKIGDLEETLESLSVVKPKFTADFPEAVRDAKTNGEACYDRSGERHLESRTSVRQGLWEAHMKSPTAALEEHLRRTEGASSLCDV